MEWRGGVERWSGEVEWSEEDNIVYRVMKYFEGMRGEFRGHDW